MTYARATGKMVWPDGYAKEVSVLLGHSSLRVTEKHYSPWVKARQDKLENSIEHALAVMEQVQK
jgi:integrase